MGRTRRKGEIPKPELPFPPPPFFITFSRFNPSIEKKKGERGRKKREKPYFFCCSFLLPPSLYCAVDTRGLEQRGYILVSSLWLWSLKVILFTLPFLPRHYLWLKNSIEFSSGVPFYKVLFFKSHFPPSLVIVILNLISPKKGSLTPFLSLFYRRRLYGLTPSPLYIPIDLFCLQRKRRRHKRPHKEKK